MNDEMIDQYISKQEIDPSSSEANALRDAFNMASGLSENELLNQMHQYSQDFDALIDITSKEGISEKEILAPPETEEGQTTST